MKDIDNWIKPGVKGKEPGILVKEYSRGEQNIRVKAIKDTMDYFQRKSKFLKREKKELEIDHAYRSAYTALSKLEDEFFKNWGKTLETAKIKFPKEKLTSLKKVGEQIKALKEQKDLWSKLESVREFTDNAMPTGTKFTMAFQQLNRRDTLLGGMGAIAGWATGGPIGGVAGAAVGGGISQGWSQAQQLGWTYLNVTKRLDRMRNAMKNGKTVGSVKWIFNPQQKFSEDFRPLWDVKPSTLGLMLLGKGGLNNFQKLRDEIFAKPELDYLSDGNEELYKTALDYGGDENASQFVAKTAEMRKDIKDLILQAGDSAVKQDMVTRLIPQFSNPIGFMQGIKTKRLTRRGVRLFRKHYPDWFEDFVTNLQVGIDDGRIKKDDVQWFLNLITPQAKKNVLYSLADRLGLEDAQIKSQRKISLGRPTQSEISAGGGYPA